MSESGKRLPSGPFGLETRFVVLGIVVVLAVIGGVGVWYVGFRTPEIETSIEAVDSGRTDSPAGGAESGPVPKGNGGVGGGRTVTRLPDLCGELDRPPEAMGASPHHDESDDGEFLECRWETLTVQKARRLTVEVRALSSSEYARREFRDYRAVAGGPKGKGFHRDPRPIHVDGSDQAYSDRSFNLLSKGPFRNGGDVEPARDYAMGGSEVVAVWHNVLIRVSWLGSDYPPGMANRKRLIGKDFAREKPEAEADALAEQVVALLKKRS